LDFLTYIIIKRLIPHQQSQYQKYLIGWEYPSWRKEFKSEWKLLANSEISDPNKYLQSTFQISDNNEKEMHNMFYEYENILEQALAIIRQEHEAKKFEWGKAIRPSLDGIFKMVEDIERYNRRITNPRTWQDLNRHT
ncbi:17489_t:CDS:2, partial [Racocetra persica]